MSTVADPRPRTQRTPRPRPARSIRWLTAPLTAAKPYGAVAISRGRCVASYYVHELPAPGGRGFAVEKIDLTAALGDRTAYHVFLHDNGRDRSCECKGFLHHGHCKHA